MKNCETQLGNKHLLFVYKTKSNNQELTIQDEKSGEKNRQSVRDISVIVQMI